MIEDIPYREFLVDSYALAYLYSLEEKDLLVLLLSKFKFHVSTLSLYEFLNIYNTLKSTIIQRYLQ